MTNKQKKKKKDIAQNKEEEEEEEEDEEGEKRYMAVQIPTDFVEGGGVPAAFAGAGHIAEQIELYQSQGDLYSKKIEIEKRRVAELDAKLKQSKSQLAEARKSMGGLHDAEAQMRKKRRQVRILENKLEKLIVRYNEATSRNEKLRTNIEDLRREKIQRQSIEDERKEALHNKKLELVEIIQQTQRAMEARDEARQNIVQLKKQIADEVGVFERNGRRG